ncbi:MAG: CBS domain-containing protein [Anaerolineae bacterium]
MRVILTHENADFDAVASQLGAWKLDRNAIPVLPQRFNHNIAAFLAAHGDELPFRRRSQLPRRIVEHATVVDSQGVVQVRGMKTNTAIRLIDHHPLHRPLPDGVTFEGDVTGACATLFVERLADAAIEVTPVEATLLLLGIYEDTGALTYGQTTARDARAVAWLLDRGASLDEARAYLYHPLSAAQRDLLQQLTRSAESYAYGPHTVVIATATSPRPVDEISTLCHRLRDLFEPAAIFLLVAMEDRLHLVARSTNDAIDVGEVAQLFGGGGHSRAAAALVRGGDIRAIHDRLLDHLALTAPTGPIVNDIMSRGIVRTVPATATVEEAARLMRQFGHEGFPVLDDGQVVGVVTRRDVDLAAHHGLGATAVTTYMHKGSIEVRPQDSLAHLQRLMLDYHIGQVPVVEDGRLIGIVTRTDLLNHQAGRLAQPSPNAELAQRFENRLTPDALALIHQASQTSERLEFGLYVVGGFVRDLLLNAPRVATDIDLVVEGDAHALVEALVRAYGGRATFHRAFGTAHWQPANPAQPPLDFVTARTEFYTEPTALPTVAESSIKLDLHRRDFTINTMALALNPERYGELLDFYGGQSDLRRRLVRVLHSLSFVEDPTRILRAVRLEQRLDFDVEPRTAELIADAIGLLDRTSGDRLRHEVYRILQEPRDVPARALRRLDSMDVLAALHPDLRWSEAMAERLANARLVALSPEGGCLRVSLTQHQVLAPDAQLSNPVPPAYSLALVAYDLDASDIEALALKLKLSRNDTRLVRELVTLKALLPRLAQPDLAPSALVRLLEPFSEAACCLLSVAERSGFVHARLEEYRAHQRSFRPVVTGDDLRAMRLPPGPTYRVILARLRDARLDGEVTTDEGEREMAVRLVEEARPGDFQQN